MERNLKIKICDNCGNSNPDEIKFCAECGSNLYDKRPNDAFICPKCGIKNNSRSLFCLNCGSELMKKQIISDNDISKRKTNRNRSQKVHNQKTHNHKKIKNSRTSSLLKTKSIWIITLIIIFSVAVAGSLDLLFHKYNPVRPVIVEKQSIDPSISSKVYEVASRFRCTCGKCNDSLNVCDCEKAVTERNFIIKDLEKGKKPEQISKEINEKYGGLITQTL